MDKYQKLFSEAAAEWETAGDVAKEKSARSRELRADLAQLEGELAALKGWIADFEANKLVISLEEYQTAADRIRYLEIRVKGTKQHLQSAERDEALGHDLLRGVSGKYRGALARMLDEDFKDLKEERGKQLDEVLR